MQADYVIVGAGSAGCVLANRLTEDPAGPGGADRGRRARLEPAHPHPGRLHEAARPHDPDLELQGRGRSRHRRPRDPLSARPGARRVLLDQRPHLHPRPARGFRPLGRSSATAAGAGTMCCPTSSRPRTGRARPAEIHGTGGFLTTSPMSERPASVPGDHRGCRRTRRRIPGRRQRPAAGCRRQHRLVPADPRRPASRQRRANLSEAGIETAQPRNCDQRAGPPHLVRRQAGDRGRVFARRPGRDRRCGARGNPRRGRGRLAASPAIVGGRRRPRISPKPASRCATRSPASGRISRTITSPACRAR